LVIKKGIIMQSVPTKSIRTSVCGYRFCDNEFETVYNHQKYCSKKCGCAEFKRKAKDQSGENRIRSAKELLQLEKDREESRKELSGRWLRMPLTPNC
jgi:predicted  nucleic acid-binding Zn-ribbon protein